MMAKKVRLKDIAAEAGVSDAVVSKILGSGSRANIRVSAETEKKVRLIAERLNYTPNINARALAGQSTGVVGILLDSQCPAVRQRLTAAIEHELSKRGLRALIGEMHDDFESMQKHYRMFRQYSVDGVICLSHDYPEMNDKLDEFFRTESNIVFYGEPAIGNLPIVELDIAEGIAEGASHFRKSGRQNVALVIGCASGTEEADMSVLPSDLSLLARRRGFLRIFPGCEKNIAVLNCRHTDPEAMRTKCRDFIENFIIPRRIDALLASNDYFGMALLGELPKYKIRVPEDLAIIGHDNEFFSEFCTPPLASIDENPDLCAESLVDMLVDIIDKKDKTNLKTMIKPKLIIRRSAEKKENRK